jgi:2-polyprenyl-6-methoxyphenol hydroxylase-like FAD-dependent oxidoreductase
MSDVRAPRWNAGRVALVGDAAAAFLPTAGIGASMALESAAVLADEVSRSDAAHVADALALYARRRRRRVLAAQQQSRWLARLVFVRSRALCALRDRALRRVSLRRMIGPIYEQLETPT